MTLTEDSIVQRHPEALATEIPDGYLVLEMTSLRCLSFAGSAARIWELLAEPASVSNLCGRLRQEYRVATDVCLAETLAHLTRLAEGGIVQVAATPS